MLSYKMGMSAKPSTFQAINEIIDRINQPSIKLVGFFVTNSYEIRSVAQRLQAKFPDAVVFGSSSAGGIGPQFGFIDQAITAFSIAADDFKVEATVVKKVNVRATLSVNQLKSVGRVVGFPDRPGFGLVLIDGFRSSEASFLGILTSIFPNVPFVGGSAGDKSRFHISKVSLGGQVHTNAAVVVFVQTNKKIAIHSEPLFELQDLPPVTITDVDETGNRVLTINDRLATNLYAEHLKVEEDQFAHEVAQHPLGRMHVDGLEIVPVAEIVGNHVVYHTNVQKGETLHLLRPRDLSQVFSQVGKAVLASLPSVRFAFGCSSYWLDQFYDRPGVYTRLYHEIGFPTVGLLTYNEPFYNELVNRSVTILAIGDAE